MLFTTPEKLAASTPALRRLVLAVRKATGIIKTDPARARKMWLEHTRTPRPLAARLNPLTLRDRNREIRTAAATFDATLPAFVNDNSLAREYFEALMGWLVKTSQVDAAAAAATDVSKYWTNSIAL